MSTHLEQNVIPVKYWQNLNDNFHINFVWKKKLNFQRIAHNLLHEKATVVNYEKKITAKLLEQADEIDLWKI